MNRKGDLQDSRTGEPPAGALIINADDWGWNAEITDRTLACFRRGAVSSVSAMVFMEDSERAAAISCERGVDAGLHLNLTAQFSGCCPRLAEKQERISRALRRHRLVQVVFNPALMGAFEYVVSSQIEEFQRLYGMAPRRIDGHHHAHLCANVLFGSLLPRGTIVRRNFSFAPGEKSIINLLYRRAVDGLLARRHRLTDFFFSLEPIEPRTRLEHIFALAHRFVVEVETHPVNPEEYRFLAAGEIFRWLGDWPIASHSAAPARGRARR